MKMTMSFPEQGYVPECAQQMIARKATRLRASGTRGAEYWLGMGR